MSQIIDIRFDAAPIVEQTIEILTEEEPQDFMEKLQAGEYVTTMSYNSENPVNEVLEVATFKVVGIVKSSENVDGTTEYIDFRFARQLPRPEGRGL